MFKNACALLAAFSLVALVGCGGGDAPKPSGGSSAPAAGGEKAPEVKEAKKEKKEAKGAAVAFPKDGKGSVKGVVSFEGVAKRPEIDTAGDKNCHAMHDKEPLLKEDCAIVKDGKLKNVIVYVKGLEKKYSFETPTEAVTIDQKGCQYSPHVFGIMVDQPLKIMNSDELTHNIHGKSPAGTNGEFNISQTKAGQTETKKLSDAELPYMLGCDVHKWMNARVGVFEHPFFAVTGDDGSFSFKGLPDGDYEIGAWHETLGDQTGKATIKDGAAAETNFSFKK